MSQSSVSVTLSPDIYLPPATADPDVKNGSNVAEAYLFDSETSNQSVDIFQLFPGDNSSGDSRICFECGFMNDSVINVNRTGEVVESISYELSVVLIALYTFTTLAAVLGNSLAIVVFAKGKRSNTDLRSFLINLAVADLLMAIVCIPFTFAYQITENWVFPDVMCPIVQCCQQVSVLASVCTNTAIGIDRFVAVKFPFRKRVTASRSKLVILCIWILSWSLGVIPLVKSRTVPRNGKVLCEENWAAEQSKLAFGFSIMIITYFLPVTILSVTYAMIGRQLWKHKLPGNADDHRDAAQLRSKRKVVKMLVTIVLLFGVCWLPLHIFIIIITFNFHFFGEAANSIYFGVHWLSMSNSFVNPLIYGFMNESFRADLSSLLHSCIRRHWGHKRLKHRSAALRWKLGDCNVHDAAAIHVQPHGYLTKTFQRHERSGRQPWRNGHYRRPPSLDLADIYCSDHSCGSQLNSLDTADTALASPYLSSSSASPACRSLYAPGKLKRYAHTPPRRACDPANWKPQGNGVKSESSHGRHAKLKRECERDPRVRFDGSDVVLLQEPLRIDHG